MARDRFRILFVCMGNICRSPSAENVMRRVAESEGLAGRLALDSAGTIDLHTGKAPDSRMTAAAARRGIDLTGAARQVRRSDFHDFDLILAMDRDNLEDLRRWERQAGGEGEGGARLALFCEFCEKHREAEVPDPYYGGPEGFEQVLDLLEDGCSVIARKIREGTLGRRDS